MKIHKNIVICSRPHDRFGFFGWPSIACQADGTVIVVASGLRYAHVCPWGKTVLFSSQDNGLTWSAPQVINNTPLDDRDAGIVSIGGQRLAVTWFTNNTVAEKSKFFDAKTGQWLGEDREMGEVLKAIDAETVETYLGSWIRTSADGAAWSSMRRAPVNAPHGFIVMKDGSWLYFGKKWLISPHQGLATIAELNVPIAAFRSTDEGRTWSLLGEVPNTSRKEDHIVEGHVIELNDGSLLGAVRVEFPYRTCFTRSNDGGHTWSELEETGIPSAPPHFMRHSSGAIICTYGYRAEPYGERARVSFDDGKTFEEEIILKRDVPYGDLGYAASAELKDGKIFTVYYENVLSDKDDEKRSLLGTIWEL